MAHIHLPNTEGDLNDPRTIVYPDGSMSVDPSGRGVVYRSGGKWTQSNLDDIRLAGDGLLSETFDRGVLNAATAPATQTVEAAALPLRAGMRINNIVAIVGVAGTAVTLVKLGLYDVTGALKAVTAESSASFGATGPKVVPVTTPFDVPSDGWYYAAFLGVATTNPSIGALSSFGGSRNAIGSGPRRATTMAGQTDMPTTLTFGQGGTSSWFGVS